MKKILLLFLFLFCGGVALLGQSWDRITSSGEFYYGEGRGDTKEQATDRALSDMIKSIAIRWRVSSAVSVSRPLRMGGMIIRRG